MHIIDESCIREHEYKSLVAPRNQVLYDGIPLKVGAQWLDQMKLVQGHVIMNHITSSNGRKLYELQPTVRVGCNP